MACDTPRQPILDLINRAAKLAGKRTNAPLTGQQTDEAISFLNMIFGEINGSPLMIFYQGTLDFEVPISKSDFVIGTAGDNEHPIIDVMANPFSDIRHVTVTLGDVTYTPQYIAPEFFRSIPVKKYGALAQKWTFELRDTYTFLRIFPEITGRVSLLGKQTLSNVGLFSSESQIQGPDQLYITYLLAIQLINAGWGNPAPTFTQEFNRIQRNKLSNSKISTTLDIGTKPRSIRRRGR